MSKITIAAIDLQQVSGSNDYVIVTEKTKQYPKGAFRFTQIGIERIAQRCMFSKDLRALKSLIQLSNGSAKLSFDVEKCVEGAEYKNAKGEVLGNYTQNWDKPINQELTLGAVALMVLVNKSLETAFAESTPQAVYTPQPKIVEPQNEPEHTA